MIIVGAFGRHGWGSSNDDTDEDGVSDLFDDYPNDPEKAFDNYSPAEGQFGTLAFEDLWPAKGDYDFNDIVIDYQYNFPVHKIFFCYILAK